MKTNLKAILDARYCNGSTQDGKVYIVCPFLYTERYENKACCGALGLPWRMEPPCPEVRLHDNDITPSVRDFYRYQRCPECPWAGQALDITPMEVTP